MKRVALLLFLVGWLVPLASAQDHFQVGAYGDYFRLSQTDTNMAGLGARVGYKAFSHVMLEGEINYDFNQAFTDHCVATGCTVTVANSNLKVLHGLFGAKIIGGHGRFGHSSRSRAALLISGLIRGQLLSERLRTRWTTCAQTTSVGRFTRAQVWKGILARLVCALKPAMKSTSPEARTTMCA